MARDCEKVSGDERFPAHFAHKRNSKKAAKVPDKNHTRADNGGWPSLPSPPLFAQVKPLAGDRPETAWACWLNASRVTNAGVPCQAGHDCTAERRQRTLSCRVWARLHGHEDSLLPLVRTHLLCQKRGSATDVTIGLRRKILQVIGRMCPRWRDD